MVTNLRQWDRLRTLADDFNRRDFQLITAFADALTVHESLKYPGTVVTGDVIPADDVMEMINDQSHNSVVRTLGRQFGVDNPRDILTRAVNMIGVHVPDEPTPHYSDSLIKTTGRSAMTISESVMRDVVHHTVFSEDFGGSDPHVTQATGMYSFQIKIQFNTETAETPRTETLTIRASSPEEAKSMAIRIGKEKNYENVSVLGVETVPYTGPLQPGLVPHTAPINVRPGATKGLVSPSDVSPALSNAGVDIPNSGNSGTNVQYSGIDGQPK